MRCISALEFGGYEIFGRMRGICAPDLAECRQYPEMKSTNAPESGELSLWDRRKGEQLDLVHLLMEIRPARAQQVDKQHLFKPYLLKVPESVSSSCSFSTCSLAIIRSREIKLRLSNYLFAKYLIV